MFLLDILFFAWSLRVVSQTICSDISGKCHFLLKFASISNQQRCDLLDLPCLRDPQDEALSAKTLE